MLKKSILFLLIISTLLLTNCLEYMTNYEHVRGSGKIISIEKHISNFDKIKISNAFETNISYGHEYQIILNIDDNMEKYIKVEKHGSTLVVGLESGVSCRHTNLEIDLILPDIKAVGGSGASEINIDGFNFDHDFEIHLSGASEFDGDLITGNLLIDVSGASEVELSGSGHDLVIDGSGASDLDLGRFKVNNADIGLSGASDVTINLNGMLNVDMSGASEVKYLGNPKLGSISTSGASSIKSLN